MGEVTKFLIAIGLTSLVVSPIIVIAVNRSRGSFAKIEYTQSSVHRIIKGLIPRDLFELPSVDSQAKKHRRKNTVKVMILEDEAYWVHDNMFYVAETVDGFVDSETVRPIDTNNMSKRDIDKMLFILDSLKNGNSDDSSGTGEQ